jgi:hypothetical protein
MNIGRTSRYVRVFVCHLFVQLIAYRAMAPLDYSRFYTWVSTYLKFNSLLFQHVLESSVQKLFTSVRTQIGHREFFARADRNAEATVLPVFDRSGTICKN